MQKLKDLKERILSVVSGGDILFIVPPFGSILDICLGPHVLQALTREKGYKADILYLNMLLASLLGIERYEEIYNAPRFWMLGERLFARSAYGLPALGNSPEFCGNEAMSVSGSKKHVKMFHENEPFDLDENLRLEQICKSFLDEVIIVISSLDYKIVGCSSSIAGLTNCCIALLNGIKKYSPQLITILGGSNCEGQKAEGIASLSTAVDYIFSGESETVLLNFLTYCHSKGFPSQRILTGEPLKGLDPLPLPDYEIFFKQYDHFLGKNAPKNTRIWYETSRGCQWAEKSKCTFCGVPQRVFGRKTINKTVFDLKRFKELYPDKTLCLADDSIPFSYHRELFPVIGQKEEFPPLGCQLKANLNLRDLINMKNAKINIILPGIESFSTNLLKLMNKGTTGKQNLLLLRNAGSVGIYCDWFLLWGLPGDKISDYEQFLNIIPLIRHLQPPREFLHIIFLPFSKYYHNRKKHKIHNLRPWNVFNMIYPDWARINHLANYYIGEYASASRESPEITRKIANEVASWKKTWKNSTLDMKRLGDAYVVCDNRDIKKEVKTFVLLYPQAKEIMTGCVYHNSRNLDWAVEQKLGIIIDSWYVPLVTASPDLLLKFEEKGISSC